jgi:hypothetical protein
VVKDGAAVAALTVSVALVLVALPALFVATQSYEPASAEVTAARVSVAPVFPPSATPPLRHCSVGVGVPDAATVKVTEPPAVTVCDDGCVVNDGATVAALTVSVAALLVAVPALFVATQSYEPASVAETALSTSEVPVWPEIAVPPLRHCSVGVGVPLAATVNVAEAPAVTVAEVGCVENDGATFEVPETTMV